MTDGGEFRIIVRRIGTREVHLDLEVHVGTRRQIEMISGEIWNRLYAGQSDRFRLFIYEKSEGRAFMTIG